MPARFASMLVSGDKICSCYTTTPHLGLEHFNQSLDCFFAISASSPKDCRLALFDERQKASASKNGLYGIVDNFMRYNALLEAPNFLQFARITDNNCSSNLPSCFTKITFMSRTLTVPMQLYSASFQKQPGSFLP